jgi:hypothetical protein
MIRFVDGNGYLIGVNGYLRYGIDDAAVVLAIQIGGEDVKSIGNVEQGVGIHTLSSSA